MLGGDPQKKIDIDTHDNSQENKADTPLLINSIYPQTSPSFLTNSVFYLSTFSFAVTGFAKEVSGDKISVDSPVSPSTSTRLLSSSDLPQIPVQKPLQFTEQVWDLSNLNVHDIKESLNKVKEATIDFTSQQIKLTGNISEQEFSNIAERLDTLEQRRKEVHTYAKLAFAADTTDTAALYFINLTERELADSQTKTLFFNFWFQDLPDEKAEHLISIAGDHSQYLQKLRDKKKYRLSPERETELKIAHATFIKPLINERKKINSNIVFRYGDDIVSGSKIKTDMKNPSPQIREKAYRALLSEYKNNSEIFGEIYKVVARHWYNTSVNERGHESSISSRNLINNIDNEAINSLLSMCEKNSDILRNYFKTKGDLLGLQSVSRFDIYAPVGKPLNNIPYHKACDIVMGAAQNFNAEYAKNVLDLFKSNHIHSKIVPGKRRGAVCYSATHQIDPFLLLSYNKDIKSLAHEIGHAVHFKLYNGTSELSYYGPSPINEIASAFNEMITHDELIKRYPFLKDSIKIKQLDQISNSIGKYAHLTRFELEAHHLVMENASVEEISALYLKSLREMLGEDIAVDDIFRYEYLYLRAPVETPFRGYSYPFSKLSALLLYDQYTKNPDDFSEIYVNALKQGGRISPRDFLLRFNIDINHKETWQRAWDIFDAHVKEIR